MNDDPRPRLRSVRTQADSRLDEIRKIMSEAEPLSIPDLSRGAGDDVEVIESELAFIRRFGFDWPRRQRELLIRLKQERDLTDREIRLLYLTGDLRYGPLGVRLGGNRWLAAWGWTQIAVVLALSAILFWAAWPVATLPSGNKVRVFAALAGLVGLAYALYLTLVRPWHIRQRTML